MTKMEELKLLEQINELIESAGRDSYIQMTFAGMVDVCRDNIENDFGSIPVRDLSDERMRTEGLRKDIRGMEKSIEELTAEKLRLSTELCDMNEELTLWKNKYSDAIANGEEQMTALRDEYNERAEEAENNCDRKDFTIMQLKAEIYDLWKEMGK